MLSRGKITPGRAKYYTQTVASGIEDYMSGRGETPGVWMGRGATRIGVDGQVTVEQMARLFEGDDALHPLTGELLGQRYTVQAGKDKVLGWDLTMSAPKSFSALWAVAPRELRAVLDACHLAAVVAGLEHLEDHAAFSRAGRRGVAQLDTDGLVIARFDHRTSRTKDPQRHSHLIVSNRVRCSDGVWRSLDSKALHRELKPAGTIYHAALRAETSARLGLVWTEPDEHGQADIEGVPKGLLEFWSQRRTQIEARAGERIAALEVTLGRSLTDAETRQQYETATLETRARKDHAVETTGDLHRTWQLQSAVHGWPAQQWLPDVLGHTVEVPPLSHAAEVIDTALTELQRSKSTWRRADAIVQCARLLPPGAATNAADAQIIVEALADAVIDAAEVVRIETPTPAPVPGLQRRDGRSVFDPHGNTSYTTHTTLQREASVLDFAHDGTDGGVAVADVTAIDEAVPGHGLDDEQQAAVRHLLAGGEQLVCLLGPAGTGKTRTLGAAVDAWAASGIPVRGLAVSAVAADVLTQETGVACDTLAKFLHTDTPETRLRLGEVVIVDEAGMAATTDLAALCAQARHARAKIVLVGDPRQLGAVEAGGLFRLLAQDYGVQLTGVRRFAQPWERAASLQLRDAQPAALDAYDTHDRLHAGSREQHIETAYRTWLAARQQQSSLLVAAPDHATVNQLAMRIRAARVQAGEVEADAIRVKNQTVSVGDEIVTLRNDRRLLTSNGRWVRNGDRWQIVGRHQDGSLDVASLQKRGHARLPADYVAEHVALAYAVTIHKAQGVTVDNAIVIADEHTTDIGLYVGLTRGRYSNHALVVTADTDHDAHGPPSAERSARDVLADVLARDAAERSATETIRRTYEQADDPQQLRDWLEHLDYHIARRAGPDLRDQQRWLALHPETADLYSDLADRLDEVIARDQRTVTAEPEHDRLHAEIQRTIERLDNYATTQLDRSRGVEIDDGIDLGW